MKLKYILGVSLVAVSAVALQADTLRLRDGRVITGTFQGATRDEVRFQADGGQMDRYDVGSIDSLSFGSGGYTNSSNRPYTGDRPYPDRPYNSNDRAYPADRPTDRGYNDQRPTPTYGRDSTQPQARDNGGWNRAAGDRYPDRNSTPYNSASGVIPAGTVLTVRMIDSVDSDSTHVGDTYHASLDRPIIVNGQTMAPAGSDAIVQVVRVQQGGRITGREDVSLALASFQVNGRTYNLDTSNEDVSSGSRGRQSGEVIGGGAALGAIIGAIAGGGSGAAIGAASGAAIGTGAQVIRGQRVRVPSETRLRFTLTRDITL